MTPIRLTILSVICLAGALATGFLGGCTQKGDDSLVVDDVPANASSKKADPPPSPEERLVLNLRVGERFPLLKTIEHILRQPKADGTTIASSSVLEMLLMATLEEYRTEGTPDSNPHYGRKRFSVRYNRVRFAQEIAGNRTVYDSDRPPATIPVEALAYHGLKENSFQFWISADNQDVEIIGFDQFLQRCLQHVPAELQQQVRANLAANSGADGIANFVDDSLGILPRDSVRPGDTWNRTREWHQPVPMVVNHKYTLRDLTPTSAEIDILATIMPTSSFGKSPITQGEGLQPVSVTVRGGQCYGTCSIDRRTGLPTQSRVEQRLQMQVQIAGGASFEQEKISVTNIRAFPTQFADATKPDGPRN